MGEASLGGCEGLRMLEKFVPEMQTGEENGFEIRKDGGCGEEVVMSDAGIVEQLLDDSTAVEFGCREGGSLGAGIPSSAPDGNAASPEVKNNDNCALEDPMNVKGVAAEENMGSITLDYVSSVEIPIAGMNDEGCGDFPCLSPIRIPTGNEIANYQCLDARPGICDAELHSDHRDYKESQDSDRLLKLVTEHSLLNVAGALTVSGVSSTTFQSGWMDGRCKEIPLSGLKNSSFKENGTYLADIIEDNQLSCMDDSGVVSPNNSSAEEGQKVASACHLKYESRANIPEVCKEVMHPFSEHCSLTCEKSDNAVCSAAEEEHSSQQCFPPLVDYHKPKQFSTCDSSEDGVTSTCPQVLSSSVGVSCDQTDNNGIGNTNSDSILIYRRCNPKRAASLRTTSSVPVPRPKISTKSVRKSKKKVKDNTISSNLSLLNSFKMASRKKSSHRTGRVSVWGTIEKLHAMFSHSNRVSNGNTDLNQMKIKIKKARHDTERRRSKSQKCDRVKGVSSASKTDSLCLNEHIATQSGNPTSKIFTTTCPIECLPHNNSESRRDASVDGCSQTESPLHQRILEDPVVPLGKDVRRCEKDLESSVTLESYFENNTTDLHGISSQPGYEPVVDVGDDKLVHNSSTSPESDIIHPISEAGILVNDFTTSTTRNFLSTRSVGLNGHTSNSSVQDNSHTGVCNELNVMAHMPSSKHKKKKKVRIRESSCQPSRFSNQEKGNNLVHQCKTRKPARHGSKSNNKLQTDFDGQSPCRRKGRIKSLQKDSSVVEFLEEKSSLVKAELLIHEETLNAQTGKQKLVSLEKCSERHVASKSANANVAFNVGVARKSKCMPASTDSSRTKQCAERRKKKGRDPCTKRKTKKKELLEHLVGEQENELLASCAEENGAPFGHCLETGYASLLGGMHEPSDLNHIRNNKLGDIDGESTGCQVPSQKSLPNDEKMLENSLGHEMQLLPPQVGWVCCDNCNKWRRIPAELVDIIRETNCKWTCKDNNDKAFADCHIPQEKTNAEINAELEISDASGEDDFHGPQPNSKTFNHAKLSSATPSSWKRIKSNIFLHRNRKTQSIDEVMVCFCKPPPDGSLGCGDGCLNRMLNIECVRGTCPCGDQCSNRQFQKRKYAKLKCIPCGKKGYGLQLLETVSEGDFLVEYVGEVLDLATYEARQKDYASRGQRHFYFMTLNGSEVIDACMKGNLGRFINHSCEPNCRTEKWMVNGEICIGLFAIRDIKKGEELTFDYNYVRVFGAAAKKCICGSAECQGYIGGDPLNSDQIVVQDDTDEDCLEPTVACEDYQREAQMDKITLDTTAKTAKQPEDNESKLDINENLQDVVDVISMQHKEKSTQQSEMVVKSTLTKPELENAPNSVSASCGSLPSVSNIANKILPDSTHTNANINLTILTNEDNPSTLKPCESKKPSLPDGSMKKGQTGLPKFLSQKAKKFLGNRSHTDNSDEVAKKLNELTGAVGGICKRKDAAKGYLKLLVVTAADNIGTETIHSQSTRDLSLILDALLKTKSRAVLMDMVNKNGLQILHNIMKQNRRNSNKIPILRKLLKVLKYLVENKVLTRDQINMIPSCPGVESFRDSIIHLTHHNDKEVHHAAREFREKWIFRATRKTNASDVDGGHGLYDSHSMKSSWSLPASNQHQDARDDACSGISQKIHLPSVSSGFDVVPETSAPSQESENTIPLGHAGFKNETKPRKRKSRWDQDEPPKKVEKDRQCMGSESEKSSELAKQDLTLQRENDAKSGGLICSTQVAVNELDSSVQDINEAPPGFDFPPGYTSFNGISRQSDQHISTFNSEVVIGKQQERYLPHLMVSHGIPVGLVQQLGTPVDGHHIDFLRWRVAPGMPFHPFPPLPPYPRVPQNECSSHRSNHLMLSSVCTESSCSNWQFITSCQSHASNGVIPCEVAKFEAVNLEKDERSKKSMDVHERKFFMRRRRHNHDHKRSFTPWHCERSGFESKGNRRHGMHDTAHGCLRKKFCASEGAIYGDADTALHQQKTHN